MSEWYIFTNQGSSTCPANGVVRIAGYQTDDDGRLVLNGNQPNKATNVLVAINSPTPVEAGKKGLCTFATLSWCAYETGDGTPSNGENWGPDNGTWLMRRDQGSLWHVIGADSNNGRVLMARMGLNAFFGKTDASHSKSAAGTVSVFSGAVGSESDTGDNESVYNSFADVDTTKKQIALTFNSQIYMISAEC